MTWSPKEGMTVKQIKKELSLAAVIREKNQKQQFLVESIPPVKYASVNEGITFSDKASPAFLHFSVTFMHNDLRERDLDAVLVQGKLQFPVHDAPRRVDI